MPTAKGETKRENKIKNGQKYVDKVKGTLKLKISCTHMGLI